jgi:hypothetical protein
MAGDGGGGGAVAPVGTMVLSVGVGGWVMAWHGMAWHGMMMMMMMMMMMI